MRTFIRYAGVLCAFLFLLNSSTPVSAHTELPVCEVAIPEPELTIGTIEESQISFFSNSDSLTIEQATLEIRKQLQNRNESFYVYVTIPYNATSTVRDVVSNYGKQLYYDAISHTGDPKGGDYIYNHMNYLQFSASYSYHSSETLLVTYEYTMGYLTTLQQERAVDIAVDTLLAQLNLDGKSDYQKICGVYDYLTANVYYDYVGLNFQNASTIYTTYGALIDNSCVCQGYASAFYRLMLELGVDCRCIRGKSSTDASVGHAWNIVKIGDVYYNLDATWDATKAQSGLEYAYFLKNETDFSQTHIRDDEFDTLDFHVAYPMSATDYASGMPTPTQAPTPMPTAKPTPAPTPTPTPAPVRNGLLQVSGTWGYYKDNVLQTGYTGLVKNSSGNWYYVQNGLINWNYTGLTQYNGTWYHIQKGRLVWGYKGLVRNGSNWYYVENSKINWSHTGLVKHTNDVWYYVQKGKIHFGYTGIVKNTNDVWYYVQNGRIAWGYTGLVKQTNGILYYVKSGRLNWNYNGTALYNGKSYNVTNGRA